MVSNSFALCPTDQTVPGILNLVLVAEYKEKRKECREKQQRKREL